MAKTHDTDFQEFDNLSVKESDFPEFEALKKKEPLAAGSENISTTLQDTSQESQISEPVTELIGKYTPPLEKIDSYLNTLGIPKGVPSIPKKEPSIYDQALEDTEKWYGNWPSPKEKMDQFNTIAAQLKAKSQFEIDKGFPADQVQANYDSQLLQTANSLGLRFEGGEVKLRQEDVDKFKEVFSRKLDQKAVLLADKNKNPYIKDVLGNLGSGSTQVLATPYNLLAISEKLGNAIMSPLGVDPSTYWQDFSKYISENQSEMAENSKRYDEDIITLAKNGEIGKAIGNAVLQTAQTLPMLTTLIAGNAAGATNSALAFMGTSSAAQEYMANNDRTDISQFVKIFDAMGVGLAEWAGELGGTAVILRGIRKGIEERGLNVVQGELTKMLQTTMQRNISMIMQGNSDMIREAISEGATQFTQNLIQKATVNPDLNIWDGVSDASIVGGIIGKGINLSLNAANNIQTSGPRKAIKGAISQIPFDYSPEAKEKLTPIILERDALEKKAENAIKPVKDLINQQIKALDEESLKIAAKEEGMELPTEEKPSEGQKKEPEIKTPESEVKVSPEGIVPLNEEKPIEKPIELIPEEKPVEPTKERIDVLGNKLAPEDPPDKNIEIKKYSDGTSESINSETRESLTPEQHDKLSDEIYDYTLQQASAEDLDNIPSYNGKKFWLATIKPDGTISNVYMKSQGRSHKNYMKIEDSNAYEEGKLAIGTWSTAWHDTKNNVDHPATFREIPQKGVEFGQALMDKAAKQVDVTKSTEDQINVSKAKAGEVIKKEEIGGKTNAEGISKNEGQIYPGGDVGPRSQNKGGQNIQQPAEKGTEAGNAEKGLNVKRVNNNLIGLTRQFNTTALNKKTVRRVLLNNINSLAGKLGYTTTLEGDKLTVLDANGKKIRIISERPTKEAIESHKGVEDYSDVVKETINRIIDNDLHTGGFVDSGLGKKEVDQAVRDIKEKKKSAAANRLLDYFEKITEEGQIVLLHPTSGERITLGLQDFLQTADDANLTDDQNDIADNLDKMRDKIKDLDDIENLDEAKLEAIHDEFFHGKVFQENEWNDLLNYIEYEQQLREEQKGTEKPKEENPPGETDKGGKGENKAAREARVKLDQEISDLEEELAGKIKEKEKFVDDYNKRNELFGDRKATIEIKTKGRNVVTPVSDLSFAQYNKIIDGFNAEIKKLQDTIDKLKANKERKIKEAGGQKEMFEEPKKEYKYQMLYRPFDIGTYPKEGFVRHEDDGSKFGVIVMNKQLTPKEYEAFDLSPVTDIENLKGKTFVDSDGYYSRIELKWYSNNRGADVSMYDMEGNLVEKPFSMSAKDILKNIADKYWIEKPSGGKYEEESFAQQKKGGKKKPRNKQTGVEKPTPTTEYKAGDQGPRKPWIDEDKMTNEGLKGIEAPELIQMIKTLTGRFPVLKRFRKALGKFYHNGIDAYVALEKGLFNSKNIHMLGKVVSHEFGHLIDYLPHEFMSRGNILGRIASLKNYFDHLLAESPGKESTVLTDEDRDRIRSDAKKALKADYNAGIREIAEEIIKEEPIFEEVGITADDIIQIWTDNMAREKNPELYEYIAKMNSTEKKQIMAKALKGLIDSDVVKKFTKGKQIGTKITREFIKKVVTPPEVTLEAIASKYKELLQDEINKRHLFQAEVITQELKDMTKWWNPYDEGMDKEYTKYRQSSKELYAEALSVLLNNPGALAERAPYFNRAFFNYFSEKPTIKALYDEMQDLMNKPREELLKERWKRNRAGYEKYEEKRKQIAVEPPKKELSMWDNVLKHFVSTALPIIKRIPENTKRLTMKLTDRQFLRNMFEKLAFANEKVAVFLSEIEKNVIKPLQDAGLDVKYMGEIMQYERQMGQRLDIANPYAFQEKASAELKAYVEGMFTPEQAQVLHQAIQTFHNMVFDVFKTGYDAGMYTKDQFDNYIEKFKDSYVTFQVGEYIERNSLTAAFKKSTGTIKEIENPFISTLFKAAAVIKGVERQNAVNTFIDMWNKYFPGQIQDAKNLSIKGPAVFKTESGKGQIEYWKNGKWAAINVDRYIAEFFDLNQAGALNPVAQLFHNFNKGFKPVVTTWNVGWAFFSNVFRDHPRTLLNLFAIMKSMEGISTGKALASPFTYLKALYETVPFLSIGKKGEARKFVEGELTPLIKEMIDAGVLKHGFFGTYDPYINEPVGPIFQSYRLISKNKSLRDKIKERSGLARFGLRILEGIEFGGQVLEVSSKIAPYKVLKEATKNAETAGFYVRNYGGTPNYLEKGTNTRTTNEIFTFSNVILQAIRTDSEMAFKPQTAGAYWMATATAVITPAIMISFAAAGLFGDKLEELYSQISEYDKTNYLCIVVWFTKDNRPVYMRIPIPEFSRIVHGITYKMLTAALDENKGLSPKDVGQLLSLGAALTPSPSPLIKTGIAWGQYMFQQNPYDSFYGRNVLTDTEQRARREGSMKPIGKMVTWSIRNLGGSFVVKMFEYNKAKNTTTEYIMKNVPVLGRAIKIGGDVSSELLRETREETRGKRAVEILKRDSVIEDYVSKALEQGKDLTNSNDIVSELQKELYGNKPLTTEQKREFTGVKKKFKTELMYGIRTPFSNAVNLIMNSSNQEKVDIIKKYSLIYGEDQANALTKYLDSQGLITKELRTKLSKEIDGINLDEEKRKKFSR